MDNKAIETLSVSAVKDSIVVCDFLDQYIAENDKEPSWDGFVYLYNKKDKKKENIKGRVSVQVKGHECDDFSNDEISFPVSIIDLKNYLNDGGVMFFVVYIGHKGLCRQIYYAELTPIKLKIFLSSAKGQETKSIKLKKFPADSNDKTMIIMNFWSNCQKQASFCEAKLFSLEELKSQGVLEGITIPVTTVGDISPKSALLKTEVYLYARIKGSSIPQPIELIPEGLTTEEERDVTILINDKIFYSKVRIIQSSNSNKIIIGESFSLSFKNETSPVQIKYKNSNKLRVFVRDLDFMISYIEHGYFMYNGTKILFDTKNADFSNFDISKEKTKLQFAKETIQLLDELNCNKDIDINSLKDRDIRNIEILIKAILKKEAVYNLKEDIPSIAYMNIEKLNFLMHFKPIKEEKGKYIISDFFKSELPIVFEKDDGEKLPISQFALMKAKDLLKTDNIRYDVLLPSFQNIEKHDLVFERANWFLLELILAYDLSDNEKQLLIVANSFADWIMSASEEESPYAIRILNKLQVVKRMRELNEEETKLLYDIVECTTSSETELVGAYLLLDQSVPAKSHFNKLSEEQQEEFKEYPIYHFWKD